MLNKFKHILFFLFALTFIIFLPTENAYGLWDIIGGIEEILSSGGDVILNSIVVVVGFFSGLIIEILMGFGNEILKFALDGVANPDGETSKVVTEGWGIVRNLANSALIIGLVIIAINIILGREEGQAKKTLINFVIVALLINFTPLICGFIIDGSNIIAKAFIGPGLSGNIATRILDTIAGIQNGNSNNPVFLIAGLIVLLFFAFAYFAICLLYSLIFIARTVVLWILIIASPLALATKVFPKSNTVRKFFPSILYWDDWIEMFLQWIVIVIPASLFLYLANVSMEAIIASPVSFSGINSVQDIVQVVATALFSYLVPLIILFVGLFISISSGGQITAPLGDFVNKAKSFAAGYVKEGGKGTVGGYLQQRGKGEGRTKSLGSALTNFNTREEGRAYFDASVDQISSKYGFKNYETRRKESKEKKDFDVEGDNIEAIKKDYDERIKKETDLAKKTSLQNERDKKIEEVATETMAWAEKEISIAETQKDKERVKDLKKKTSLFLLNNNEKLLSTFEKNQNVLVEDVINKMSGSDIVKNVGAASLKKERVARSLGASQIQYVVQRGSTAQQNGMMEGAASINLDNYNKGTKDYNNALQTKSNLYAFMNKKQEKDSRLKTQGSAQLGERQTNIVGRLRNINSSVRTISAKANKTEVDKKDLKSLREEARSLIKEHNANNQTIAGGHYT